MLAPAAFCIALLFLDKAGYQSAFMFLQTLFLIWLTISYYDKTFQDPGSYLARDEEQELELELSNAQVRIKDLEAELAFFNSLEIPKAKIDIGERSLVFGMMPNLDARKAIGKNN